MVYVLWTCALRRYGSNLANLDVKEKDIEAKLKQVINDWSAQNFQFSNFKSRGELLLKGNNSLLA